MLLIVENRVLFIFLLSFLLLFYLFAHAFFIHMMVLRENLRYL